MARLMKNSGIQWIGDIPRDWKISTLGKVSNIITGNTPSKSDNNLYYSDNGLKWVKPDNLNGLLITQTKEYINEKGRPFAKIVPPYTPLMCCIGSIGKIGYCETETAFNQQINAILFNENILWKYGYYYLISQEEQHWFYANGNVLKILNTENQKKIFIVIPPLEEQQRIANYLDEKCSKIDETIEKEKAIIEKLKEYKQSLITETVTKGLNPNVPMKDSGIDWIGSIPQHWKYCRIKYNTYLKGRIGWQGLKASEFIDEGAYLVTGTDFENGKVNWSKCYHISMERYNEAPEIHLKKDDLLITKDGTIGKLAYIDFLPNISSLNSHLLLIRPISNLYTNKFLYWIFSSNIFKIYTDISQNGTIMASLTQEQISNFFFYTPPIEEQEEISKYLDEKCNAIDNAITQRETLIDKLTEYKKSLIYECVTGKKEV